MWPFRKRPSRAELVREAREQRSRADRSDAVVAEQRAVNAELRNSISILRATIVELRGAPRKTFATGPAKARPDPQKAKPLVDPARGFAERRAAREEESRKQPEVRSDSSSDLLNPLSLLSPLNPLSPISIFNSTPSVEAPACDTGSSHSTPSSSYDSGSSSSSSDSGSSGGSCD